MKINTPKERNTKMFDTLRGTLKVRRERKAIAKATERVEADRKQRHAFMMELSAAGYDIVKRPAL
jgi:hypothetical protein